MKNKFWIVDSGEYGFSETTCVATNRSLPQVLKDLYFILHEADTLRLIADDSDECVHYDETEPHSSTMCHLLIKNL